MFNFDLTNTGDVADDTRATDTSYCQEAEVKDVVKSPHLRCCEKCLGKSVLVGQFSNKF